MTTLPATARAFILRDGVYRPSLACSKEKSATADAAAKQSAAAAAAAPTPEEQAAAKVTADAVAAATATAAATAVASASVGGYMRAAGQLKLREEADSLSLELGTVSRGELVKVEQVNGEG